ncbi:hypothetical protein COCC4DRAFT_39394 [Bipolaris maydis ATCC 48331]|uniref:DNA polymerase delta subunit 3 n=2 Tax=Cochliobolus heterostrophus TaxID=5016 RepID=M2TX16_COCH5|nr:uncharacterized protein COCC4DRAFT_39394 [Bipolaris maydis ATCC 48331]EMD86266.1 hypothetical protein COCHEDRAFT_1186232 [Bipolaris maydis C5]KAJ5030059.1 DNA polymerase subunit Cdc27 [Bipolaris maydis]ENI06211.1 hypothetical protein COCC4DRAFT_39394 [Bipolaris maydis ATCC 48331]KAJ5065065.1 DNA polymerase subunit Cdc27 [Bipolaris maydis]KAJ6200278.1 DNA polymerase subunit Cdc27 [Bipolaris maydis]
MAQEDYKDYLAARILAENKPVTYRLLSRALKTNVNTAKRMLAEFYKTQNARKSKSVHATYLLTGTPRNSEQSNGSKIRKGEDTDMRSSPFMSSMPDQEEDEDSDYASGSDDEDTPAPRGVKETQVLLVREEELEETLAGLEEGASVHIYSLEPGRLEIFGVLSLCNHEGVKQYADENPLERWKTYGSIRNQYIKRRTAKYAPPTATNSSKASAKPASKPAEKPASKPAATVGTKDKESTEENASGRSTPQPSASASTLKRSDSKSGAKKDKASSDIFKSFAKAKPKAKESTPAPVEDEPMQGMSEDEGDPDDEPEVKINEEKNEAARKAREERAERLRKMMEDDDEDMPDAPAAVESQTETTPTATATADAAEPAEDEATFTVTNGRRRGRRRVMKKKKVKDEDGYLVTKEEAVWESFSEEEPAPKKAKPAPAKPASSAKGKNAGKKGQGSIASFFKKA